MGHSRPFPLQNQPFQKSREAGRQGQRAAADERALLQSNRLASRTRLAQFMNFVFPSFDSIARIKVAPSLRRVKEKQQRDASRHSKQLFPDRVTVPCAGFLTCQIAEQLSESSLCHGQSPGLLVRMACLQHHSLPHTLQWLMDEYKTEGRSNSLTVRPHFCAKWKQKSEAQGRKRESGRFTRPILVDLNPKTGRSVVLDISLFSAHVQTQLAPLLFPECQS